MKNERSLRLGFKLAAVLGLSLTAFDCGGLGQDESKCKTAQDGLRGAIKADDRALTEQWRKYAYSHCSDKSELGKLDQGIVQAQAEADRKRAEKKKREADKKQVVSLFSQWVSDNRAAPQTSAANVTCDGGPAEAKTLERWCWRTRSAGPYSFEARYRDKDPQSVRFSVTLPDPITCGDLGPTRVIREWTIQGSIKRFHCEITGGALTGMQALVTEAREAPLMVFSPRFAELDSGFQSKIANEGR